VILISRVSAPRHISNGVSPTGSRNHLPTPNKPSPSDPEQTLLATALWSAAVIAYRRAFAVGKGHLVPKSQRFDIKGLRTQLLTPEQAAVDDQLRQMADQHVAHRVSDLEQMRFLVALTPPPLPPEVAGLGTMMVHMIGPEAAVAKGLSEFAMCF
jgi:hypothetical protein